LDSFKGQLSGQHLFRRHFNQSKVRDPTSAKGVNVHIVCFKPATKLGINFRSGGKRSLMLRHAKKFGTGSRELTKNAYTFIIVSISLRNDIRPLSKQMGRLIPLKLPLLRKRVGRDYGGL
jgi:hypothetical protein